MWIVYYAEVYLTWEYNIIMCYNVHVFLMVTVLIHSPLNRP